MGIEFKDRRAEKAAAESEGPTALEIVEDRKDRYQKALIDGDIKLANKILEECQDPPAIYPGKVTEFKKTVPGEVQQFKGKIGYTVVQINVNGSGMFAGRAAGLRTDDCVFTADYLFAPVWEEEESWQVEARKRLMTFKACSCRRGNVCGFHGEACPGKLGAGKWMEEDIKRLNKVMNTPLCEALEVLMRAEKARAEARIVAPGR